LKIQQLYKQLNVKKYAWFRW